VLRAHRLPALWRKARSWFEPQLKRDRDRAFLAWVRDPKTTRGALVMAREKAFQEWHFCAIQRELDRRERALKSYVGG